MVERDANNFNSDLQTRIENTLKSRIDRLPVSDRIVLLKIRQLPIRDQSFNPYREAISKFFDGLVCKYEIDEKCGYLDLKLRLLKDVLQELWVIKARKGETFKLF